MRTTVTLEADVAVALQREMRRTGRGLKAVINQAVRRGLGGASSAARRFSYQPHHFGTRPGLDLDRMNQLADELDARTRARQLGR
ncbi:MAG: hypothetical protein ACRD01_13205 [Terriglobales bacterium]